MEKDRMDKDRMEKNRMERPPCPAMKMCIRDSFTGIGAGMYQA